jgi:hypothetical protein
MKIKSGREEIVYLLTKVVEKHEQATGQKITLNTNRKNYEDIARLLSDISNELPNTAGSLQHDVYSSNVIQQNLEHPYRKYDITGGQIKDAYNGIVANPRPFMVDACYIYLFGKGRKGFEENPLDDNLLIKEEEAPTETEILKQQLFTVKEEKEKLITTSRAKAAAQKKIFFLLIIAALALAVFAAYKWFTESKNLAVLKKDMNILPYKPTQAEIDSLEGVWLCYTSSPQARRSEPNRFHLVIANVVSIQYKDGYFVYNRYGASFNQAGYAQFEAPQLVSIHTHVKNATDLVESPRHSLMQLDSTAAFLPVISTTWSFDVGENNIIIGNREVYTKMGKGGTLEEVINTIENASCKCKIVRWQKPGNHVQIFQLKNQVLDSLPQPVLKSLLDEKSIILRVPQEGIILSADTIRH